MFPFCIVSQADFRTFTNSSGATIKAEIIEYKKSSVITIRKENGEVFRNVNVELFSEADRKFIQKWIQQEKEKINNAEIIADSKLEIFVAKARDNDMNEYNDIDDRIISFKPRLTIDSKELYKTYTNVTGTLVFIGRGYVHKKEYCILDRQDFTLTLPPNQKVEWEGKSFKCRYDPDYAGFDYNGYILVINDKSGNPVIIKSSTSFWEDNLTNIFKAKKKRAYDRDFTNERSPIISYWLR